jgi:hypothetical protein
MDKRDGRSARYQDAICRSCYDLLNPPDRLVPLLYQWLRQLCRLMHSLGKVLLGTKVQRGCSQDVVDLTATVHVLLLELPSESLVFLC